MIILDTNVISELMKTSPEPSVRAWTRLQRRDQLVTTAIALMELRAGVEKLLQSKRRRELEAALDWALDDLLGGRVLNFDRRAALAAAKWHAHCHRIGHTIQLPMRRSLALQSPAIFRLRLGTCMTSPTLA